MLPQSCDVLIVGAGPVGLTTAITLLQSGIRPLLIDTATEHQTTSRAAVIHAHTLETLDRLGVASALVTEGRRLVKFAFRDRDRMLGLIRFDGLPSEHNYLLMLPQDRTETILLARLAELGGEVVRGVTFTGYTENGGHVLAELRTGDATARVRTNYLVGADGMYSAVRQAAAIPFDGAQYEGSFVLADISFSDGEDRDEVSLFFSPDGLVVLAPLPGNHFRVVATVEDAPEKPDAALIQALLDRRGPERRRLGHVRDVTWSSRFRLHHRLARQYRRGRVFVAGDAAHAHSPAGGQGMNTGLVDAYVLGRLLAEAVVGPPSVAALDHYEALRRPAAAEVLELAGRLTAAATLTSPWKRALRNSLLWTLARIPRFRRQLALNLSGVARRSAVPVD